MLREVLNEMAASSKFAVVCHVHDGGKLEDITLASWGDFLNTDDSLTIGYFKELTSYTRNNSSFKELCEFLKKHHKSKTITDQQKHIMHADVAHAYGPFTSNDVGLLVDDFKEYVEKD